MKLHPVNKYILVEKIEFAQSKFIPEHMRETVDAFCVVQVLDAADDCDKLEAVLNGDLDSLKVVVQSNGLEKVRFHNEDFLIVSEKFVVGILED